MSAKRWRRWREWLWVGLLVLAGSVLPGATSARTLGQEPGHREVFLPMAPSGQPPATPQPTLAVGERVYGLMGRLERTLDEVYAHGLVTSDAGTYALAGETPEIEMQISALAGGPPPVMVKVWGVRLQASNSADTPLLVVSGILAVEPPVPVGGQAVPVAIGRFDLVNLHAEPRESSAKVGAVVARQACNVTGRNASGTWVYLSCADGQEGWIDARLVEIQGGIDRVPVVDRAVLPPEVATPVATVAPTPIPQPTMQIFRGWRTEMYGNPYLSGEPVAVMDAAAIDFNWQYGAPSTLLPVDNFSLRFERRVNLSPAYYRFTAQADDGVRLWLDGQLLIDEWHGPAGQVYSAGRILNGEYDLRVEYYEASGLASVRVGYEAVDQTPVWSAAYFRGTSLGGEPVLRQQEPRGQNPLEYTWGTASPVPGQLDGDLWSARWEGEFPFDEGTYMFQVVADDGIRVWIDGLPVIDQWQDGYKQASNRFVGIGSGSHSIKVEYYERSGQALVKVWWYKEANYTGPR